MMENKVKNYIEYFLFRLLLFFIRLMPLQLMRKFTLFMAFLLFKVFGVRKKISLENLSFAFPEKSEKEIKNIAYESFKNFSLTLMELMWIPKLSVDKFLQMFIVENKEELDNYMKQENGKIILTAHFGNWEYLGHYIGVEYKVKYPAIVKRMRNILVDEYVKECRTRYNYLYPLYMDKNIKEVFNNLLSGKPMAILADQSAPQESIYIKFFNRYATTFQGPAVFALRCKVPIRLVLAIREQNYKLRLIHEEINTSDLSEASDENIYELSKRHVELLEKYIRKYPEQWLWSHRRWKHTDKYELYGKQNK